MLCHDRANKVSQWPEVDLPLILLMLLGIKSSGGGPPPNKFGKKTRSHFLPINLARKPENLSKKTRKQNIENIDQKPLHLTAIFEMVSQDFLSSQQRGFWPWACRAGLGFPLGSDLGVHMILSKQFPESERTRLLNLWIQTQKVTQRGPMDIRIHTRFCCVEPLRSY